MFIKLEKKNNVILIVNIMVYFNCIHEILISNSNKEHTLKNLPG